MVDINNFKPEYLIADIECIKGYFSFQFRKEDQEKANLIECIKDADFHTFYVILKKINRPMYFYSIDYDKVMLNCLCKMCENKVEGIGAKLREINDLIIKGNFNYFQTNRQFWCDGYFRIKDSNPYMKSAEIMEMAKIQIKNLNTLESIHTFTDKYSYCYGQSKVIKALNILSVPKIMYYYVINKDRSLKPTISLKKLQLIQESYNIKWDFNYDDSWSDLSQEQKEEFRKYGLNDVDFLYRFFQGKCLSDIMTRFYAAKAAFTIDNTLCINETAIYAENNTELIVSILKRKEKKEDIEFKYTDYITTNNQKFNNLVKFTEENSNILNDYDLKNGFCEYYKLAYIDDDINIYSHDGYRPDTQINSFDEIELNGTVCKVGYGGIHGAINNYTAENLRLLDYTSQYPSIILQYKELFESTININMYEAIYNLKCVELKEKLKDDSLNEEVKQELNRLLKGVKLILNTAYGLINSNFDIEISNKKLGRFICLKGQSLIINLAAKLENRVKIPNVNTDGVILKDIEDDDINTIMNLDKNGYFTLDCSKIDKLYQKDVNNYISISGDYLKSKGMFNPSIKQEITKNEKLTVNLKNALRLLQDKQIEIMPIYFDSKWFKMLECAWYLTTQDKGEQAVKEVKQPQIIGIDSKPFYFTNKKEDADIKVYAEYAKITLNKILNFNLETDKKEYIKYFEVILKDDTVENNNIKSVMRKTLLKAFPKNIGLVGFKGDVKANSVITENGKNKIIKPLIQYTMTQIKNSTYCNGLSVHGDYLIIDVDIMDKKTGKAKKGWEICKPFLNLLKEYDTFECWNSKTKTYNKKFIFQPNPEFKIPPALEGYIEIINKATIWSLPDLSISYQNNGKMPKEFKNV